MICNDCKNVAAANRTLYEIPLEDGSKREFIPHPDCECACGHEDPTQWEKMYRTPPPWKV